MLGPRCTAGTAVRCGSPGEGERLAGRRQGLPKEGVEGKRSPTGRCHENDENVRECKEGSTENLL